MFWLLYLFSFANYVLQGFASWSVTCPPAVQAVTDSCLWIPCTFGYPSSVVVPGTITAIWYKDYNGQRAVVYHSASPDIIDAQFRDRAELLGDPLAQNCTLLLRHVKKEDSAKYTFRFEITEKDRWSAQSPVQLTVTDHPNLPTITFPEDLQENTLVTFNCSSPYACAYDSISLQWAGYKAESSHVSKKVQMNTDGVCQKQTLKTWVSWQDHNRKINCKLSVGTQVVVNELTLSVKHSPKGVKASLNPSTKNIRVGDTATLICTINSSNPDVTAYRWFKDAVAVGNEPVKTIQSVARGDYGLYHCEAENSIGIGVAEAVTLNVFSAVLTLSPSASVQEGERVTLTCDVPGEEKQEVHYSWYKNNVWIKAGTARTLVFHEAVAEDTGYFSCKVQNDKGSEMSPAVVLTVFYPPRQPSLALFQETQEGKLAIIYCTVDSNPQSSLTLYRGKLLMASTGSHLAPNQRLSVTTTRNSLKLEIQKVVPEDEGEYQCVATNQYGEATIKRFFGAQTARVKASPSEEVPAGEKVTLTCVATLSTEEGTSYTWYKNAKWLQAGPERSLIFAAVASGDAGMFHCVAQNKKGTNTSPSTFLHVLYPPRKPVLSSFLETRGGHLGTIRCDVDSDPPSEITLYKSDDVLVASTTLATASGDARVRETAAHNMLKVDIQDVVLEDEGRYTCSAQNLYGASSASLDFTAETARIIAAPSSKVREGETVQLICEVTSNSSNLANYTWYKDGRLLSEAVEKSLMFPQVARKDAGMYFCQVEIQRMSKSSPSLPVSVLYPPGTPEVTVFMETETGKVAVYHCLVDSNPPAKLALYKGDKLVASSGPDGRVAPPRVTVTATPNAMRVEMRNVVPEDEGSYNFTATNAYGVSSRSLYFRVQTARVLVTPSPELLEGDTAVLTCDVMGSAPEDATFSWYKNSKRIPESQSSTLTFRQIASGDAGSYHCKAYHKASSLSVSASVSIRVFYPPRTPQLTSFSQTAGGQVALIHCTVDSDPQSQLAIFKGDKKLLASSLDSKAAHSERLSVSTASNSLRVEIRDVVMEDEGDYTCSASNAYGNSISSVKLTADTARLWISPPDVLEGQSVSLTCAVDSDAPGKPHYTWYKNHRWYAEGPSKTLVLPHSSTADAGSYFCAAKTAARIRNSTVGILNVLYAPRDMSMKSFVESQEGKVAVVTCTVDSNPPSELSLHQDDEVLAVGTGLDPRRRVASSLNSLRLQIKDVGLADEGHYECVAHSALGQARASLDFTVETTRVVIKPSPEVQVGQSVSLTCEDRTAQANSVYTWYKNTAWLSEGSAAALAFQAVTASNMGSYSCQVRNEGGVRKSLPATLHVLYAPKKPSFTSFLETQSGAQAVLRCTVDSHPPSHITLYRGSTMVAASSRSSGTWPSQRFSSITAHNALTVEIKTVSLDDEGQYLCLANNTYGTSTAFLDFSVARIRITVDPSAQIREGASANLTCLVASWAVGEMNYTWYKNGNQLQDGPGQSLLLQDATKDDAGMYHCQVGSGAGSVTSTPVMLNVLYAPGSPFISAFLDNRDGKVGILHCKVESHPQSELAFYKGGKLVARTHASRSAAGKRFIPFPSYNSLRLEIQDITAEDSGQYVCLARNLLGNMTSAVDFSAETLSDLLMFKILAGVFMAMMGALLLTGLALTVQKNWTWLSQQWWKTKQPEVVEKENIEDKEDAAQLDDQSSGIPHCGRFCLSYKRLPLKTEAPPMEPLTGQESTSPV